MCCDEKARMLSFIDFQHRKSAQKNKNANNRGLSLIWMYIKIDINKKEIKIDLPTHFLLTGTTPIIFVGLTKFWCGDRDIQVYPPTSLQKGIRLFLLRGILRWRDRANFRRLFHGNFFLILYPVSMYCLCTIK